MMGVVEPRAPMHFTHRPQPLPESLYQEAAREYARRTGRRAVAIYRVGAFRQAGFSDLDLLVVPRKPRRDNHRWFSVRHQLPPRLRAPFRHDPDILPSDQVDVLRFTTHAHRRLIFGEDVAAGIRCLETPEQRWSMLFERLCDHDDARRRALQQGTMDLWKLMAKTKSIAISLADLDRLTGSEHAGSFASEVETLRAEFCGLGSADAGERFWKLFDGGLACIETGVAVALGLDAETSPVDFGRRFLHGEASIPGLSEAALAERREAVHRVQRATRALGCRGGDVITRNPYKERIQELQRAHRPARWQRVAFRTAYRLRDAWIRIDSGAGRSIPPPSVQARSRAARTPGGAQSP